MIVIDASVVAAAFISQDADGQWAEAILRSRPAVSPYIMPVEAVSSIRRRVLAGVIPEGLAEQIVLDISDFPIELAPWRPIAARAWELRHTVTPYDAWYVALAEALDAPLATLDLRLADAPGPTCRFVTP